MLKLDTSIRIPPLIKRNTVYFAIAQAFVGMGTQMTPTLGAIMVVRLLGSASLAGIGTSILGVGRFLVAYPVGKINDTYGRKVGMILGLLLSLIASLIIGLSISLVSFPLFLVGMVIFGLGVGAGEQLSHREFSRAIYDRNMFFCFPISGLINLSKSSHDALLHYVLSG